MKVKHLLIVIIFFLSCSPVKADFISLIRADKCETIIEIYIEDGQIRVTYEVGMKDWKYFKEILPADLFKDEIRKQLESQDKNYFYNDIFILNADGQKLKGQIVRRELIPRKYRASLYSGVVDEDSEVSKEVFLVDIVYPLPGRIKNLVITPPLENGLKGTRANIGFITYHKKIPVNDLGYLSRPSTVRLNWEDPWYSKFDNINLRRHHQSSLMSFLYVDPYEVRHEVLVRVKDLEEWIDMGYELDDVIEIEDQDALKEKISQFLKNRNLVTIDGVLGNPLIDKVHFVKWSLAGIQIQEVKEKMDYSSAVIGIIFAYPHDGIAQNVRVEWDMFSEKIESIPNVATDPAGPMPSTLNPENNVLVWTNFLKKYKLPTISEVEVSQAKIPVVYLIAIIVFVLGVLRVYKSDQKLLKTVIVLVGGSLIVLSGAYFKQSVSVPFLQQTTFSRPEASELVNHLLKNTYRAFDFREESDIYDKLAVSNDEILLADLYIQTKKSMVMEQQGGIQVKVKEVEVLEVEEVSSDSEGISFKCTWKVQGDVGHWGHIHSRINQYEAILHVKPIDGVWKFDDLQILEEIRL